MSLSIGIVGLPNVGKSTLFTALTKKTGLAANYPFATIDPNVGIVDVPDSRLQKLADIVNPGRIVPATVEFVDIAGLVKGANEGEGLGNQFLANIRETDAICEVVRYFKDPNVMREVGRTGEFVDPAGDVTRWGKSYELLALPVLNLLLSVATYFTAGRQAKNNEGSAVMARLTCERYLRNGCITGVFLNVINVYFMYSAITGTGFGFGF